MNSYRAVVVSIMYCTVLQYNKHGIHSVAYSRFDMT